MVGKTGIVQKQNRKTKIIAEKQENLFPTLEKYLIV